MKLNPGNELEPWPRLLKSILDSRPPNQDSINLEFGAKNIENYQKIFKNIQSQLCFGWQLKQRPLWLWYDEHTDGSRKPTIDHKHSHAPIWPKIAIMTAKILSVLNSMIWWIKDFQNHPSSENIKLYGFDNEWGLRFQIFYPNNQCFEMTLDRFRANSIPHGVCQKNSKFFQFFICGLKNNHSLILKMYPETCFKCVYLMFCTNKEAFSVAKSREILTNLNKSNSY